MKVFFTFLFIPLALITAAQTDLPPCDINLGPDVVVCNNAVFELNPHPVSGGTYNWNGSSGLSCYDCPTPTVSGLGTGIYTFIATVTTVDCSASDTLQITVINGESPQYEIIESQDICTGDSIALGGAPIPGIFYNWSSLPIGFVSNLANPKAKPAGQTTYYLSVSNTSCPLPVLDSVKISPINLNLTLVPADTAKICKGQSRTIQATVSPAGQPISWMPTTGLQITGNGSIVIASPTVSTLYTATVALGGCVRQRQIYIAVDSLPSGLAVHPADTTICQGQTVNLTSSPDLSGFPNITFKWTPLTGALTPDNLLNLTVQPNQTTPYRRITRNGVCADTVMALVKVVPTPQMTASPEFSSICLGDTVRLHLTYSNGVGNIKWSPPTGLDCTTCDNPLAKPLVSTTYIASGSAQGCADSDTVEVMIRPLPPLKFPSDVMLCPGDSVLLNEIFDPLANYTWTSTHPGFGTVTIPNPGFKPTQTATYFVTADNGCLRSDSIKIFVNTALVTVDGDTTVCKNFSVPLSASANLMGTFSWRNDLTGQTVGAMQTISVSPSVTTPYSLIFTYGDNCQITEQVTVTINGEAPEILFPTDTKLCPGESITLNSALVLPGAVYNWVANPADPTLMATASMPVVTPTKNTIYAVTAKLGNCTVSKQLDVTAFSASLNTSPDTTICAQTQILLAAIGSSPDGKYSWSTGDSTSAISKSPAVSTNYMITYTYGDNCSLKDTIVVTVLPGFSLDIQCVPDTNKVNVGTEVTLTAVVTPPQNLSNFNFRWEETTVDTKLLPFNTESIDVVPTSNDTASAFVRYTLTATAPNGCKKIIEKSISLIFPLVRFPNAFTPDGDGNNDVFKMVLLQGLAIVDRMEIFNRWGQKIFESMDPDANWDGTSKGEQVPADVYIYRVWWRRGDGALQMQSTGNITLLR